MSVFYNTYFIIFSISGFIISVIAEGYLLGRRLRVPVVTGPSCGYCQSLLRNSSMTCAVCASDLREVGIILPSMRRPLSFWWVALIWTLFIPVQCETFIFFVQSTIAPAVNIIDQSVVISNPISHHFDHINIEVRKTTKRWPWEDHATDNISLDPDAKTFGTTRVSFFLKDTPEPDGVLEMEYESMAWRFTMADGTRTTAPSGLNIKNFHEIWTKLGMTDDPHNLTDMEIGALITQIEKSPGILTGEPSLYDKYVWTITSTKNINYYGPPKQLVNTLIAIAALIYILGLIFIHRWTKQEKTTFNLPAKITTQPQSQTTNTEN